MFDRTRVLIDALLHEWFVMSTNACTHQRKRGTASASIRTKVRRSRSPRTMSRCSTPRFVTCHHAPGNSRRTGPDMEGRRRHEGVTSANSSVWEVNDSMIDPESVQVTITYWNL